MKIKALWGFHGNAELLGADENGVRTDRVRTGQVFEEADDEYAYILVGKGLAAEVTDKTKPKEAKPAASKETK